ncbi:MAG TPA: 3,4-dihydroxy-2-butanone-4-phosphate synthase, partial [Beijerinckiaceae bacterium]|nr:3,4-dihydroxy-2-butanone-4-phosphate synthase [Beijerinckiaceae bacterium]
MQGQSNILEWIRKGLEKPGLSQAGLAEALGIDRAQVTRLLQGKRELKVRELKLVGDYLGAAAPAMAATDALDGAPAHDVAASVTEAIEAIARGEIVIVTDDDDRENEGDLIMAASLCTPEKMAFIIRNCCGIVCAPLPLDEARRLHLQPMVAANDAPLGTAFTVSVDVKHGLTTGISAEQRSNTVRALANGNMGAADFVRPGHVFPLIAREGGVLMRSGHTEAAVDLCRLAGLPPVGVICELANDDGTVMAGKQIDAFAEKHNLKRISVA